MGTNVAANGPVEFTDSSSGKQLSIPLSAIYFDATGAIKADHWPLYAANSAFVDAWLKYLVQNGTLIPATQAPPTPAMIITAKDPGSSGNYIQVAFSNVSTDPQTKITTFDVTVTETDTYTLLTLLTPGTMIKDILGTAPGTGKRPGLVYVASGGNPDLPEAGVYKLSVDLANLANPATQDIKNASAGVAFTVSAKSAGTDGALTTVTIKDIDSNAAPQTFTLVAIWTKTATGIQVTDLQSSFAYEITVSQPDGGTLAVPAPGTITLTGGADAQAPISASATVTANQ